MNSSGDFDSILNDCLEALLSGERSLEDCLAQYPDQAADFKEMLQVALLTRHLKKPEMDSDAVQALETRLRGQMLARSRPRSAVFAPYRKLAAMIAIAFMLTMAAGTGAVAASANTVPGDFLYPLKRFWEAIVLALSSLSHTDDDIWLHLAETRLDEAETLASRGELEPGILVDVYDASAEAITLADAQTAPQVIQYLKSSQSRLQKLPVDSKTAALRSDLLLLAAPAASGVLPLPVSMHPPSLNAVQPPLSATNTPTFASTPLPTATFTPSPTNTTTPTNTVTPSLTPTSRVPATATETPSPTRTPRPTATDTVTPTQTWTPLPLPGLGATSESRTGGSNGSSDHHAGPTEEATIDASATVRYRDTPRAIYATQTAEAQDGTEEPAP